MNLSKIDADKIDHKYLREAFVPLGLFGFSITTILLSLYNVGAFGHADQPLNKAWAIIFLSVCGIFLGGIMQVIAGIYTIRYGHIKSGTIFCSFGAFWLIWSIFNILFYLIPREGTEISKLSDVNTIHSYKDLFFGVFLMLFAVICAFSFFVSLYRNIITSIIFFVLVFAFFFLGLSGILAGAPTSQAEADKLKAAVHGLDVTGGVFGLFAGFGALYLGWAVILSRIFNKNFLALGKPILHAKNKTVFDIDK